MLLTCKSIIKTLPIIRLELYNKENSFFVQTNFLKQSLFILKNHFIYQFKVLTYISGFVVFNFYIKK
jgi:hypothetical protein